jgi:hypothetical protein
MKQLNEYEGSVAEIGGEEWSEPHRRCATTAESAAAKIIESHLECGEIESDKKYAICVRDITNGITGEWKHFYGRAWAEYHSVITLPQP